MPFTPFHLGPGLLVGLVCGRRIDLPATPPPFPFAPVSAANPALGLVGLLSAYLGCAVVGLLGLCLYAASLLDLVALPDPDPA